MSRFIITLITLTASVIALNATSPPISSNNSEELAEALQPSPLASDSIMANTTVADTVTKAPKVGFWKSLKNYLSLDGGDKKGSDLNKVHVLGGPFYDNQAGFGIALMAASNFKFNQRDTLSQPSFSQLYFNISTKKFWKLGMYGSLFLNANKWRINYDMSYENMPSYFYGIGYEKGNDDANKTMQHKHIGLFHVEALMRITGRFRVGPAIRWNYVNSDTISRPELLEGQDRILRNYGIGLVAEFDSRDNLKDAYSGWYLYGGVITRPKFLWNTYAFTTLELRARHYRQVWKGGVIAGDLYGLFNFGNPSWAMMSLLGNSNRMRGYYQGRYRDKHMINLQVELRQHVWRRHGITLWAGVGNVFHDGDSFGHLLPNFGIGYRFAFRRRTNIRLDFGIGKSGQNGFVFNINEAF